MTQIMSARGKIRWNFRELKDDERENEQTQEEFFSNESLISEVASIVRESIQNSLDERLDANDPIRVRFKLGIQNPLILRKYFEDLIPHADAKDTLPFGAPSLAVESKYLVIEDFNTLGLEGSTSSKYQEVSPEQIAARGFKNSFWFFEWKTGKSNKSSGKRGSWGVGKIVFPRASAIKSYLVLSERRQLAAPEGDSCILFGHSILKYRTLDDVRYVPDCQWMAPDSEGRLFPSASPEEANEFRADWKLSRAANELGTSIVVPFVNEAMSSAQLLNSIARDYFVTILSEMLVCEVEEVDGSVFELNAENLISQLKLMEEPLTRDFRTNAELIELCSLYVEHLKKTTTKFEYSTPTEKVNSWSDFKLSDDVADKLIEAFDHESGVEISVETKVPAKRNGADASMDKFTVLIKRSDDLKSSTVFCREGILIPGANKAETRGLISIVLVGHVGDANVEENSLASLLKNAEGPSHEKWTVTASHFKGVYTPEDLANRTVDWVKRSVQYIYRHIHQRDLEPDAIALSKFFPEPNEGSSQSSGGTGGHGMVPKVRLSGSKMAGNPREILLSWNNVLIDQEKVILRCITPGPSDIFIGEAEDRTHKFVVPEDLELITFQAEVHSNSDKYLSNKLTFTFDTLADTPELSFELVDQKIVVRPMDPGSIEPGMEFQMELGYAVRGGVTFGAGAEFDLDAMHLVQEEESSFVEVRCGSSQNQLIVAVTDSKFKLILSGFNPVLDPAISAMYLGVKHEVDA